jgi:SNF2 family DNA or RNA helicase
MKDLNRFILEKDKNDRMKNIHFIHYDSPKADRDFIDAVKSVDVTKKNIYIFEEVHNFINNVFNNIKMKKGRRALTIYDYIIREKKENDNTRVILLSGTPIVNDPFELALIFNLLRPEIFPLDRNEFNEIYITDDNNKMLNPINKNMFQRRIMGLVSYYYGSNKDVFAEKNVFIKKIMMSEYQQEVYDQFELIEAKLEAKRSANRGGTVYRSYTRQGSNFIFPVINDIIKGENRPRPSKYKLTERDNEKIMEGNIDNINKEEDDKDYKERLQQYLDIIKKFTKSVDEYFLKIKDKDLKNGNTLQDDIKLFKDKYNYKFSVFWKDHINKSELLTIMYNSSCKITAMMFYMLRSKGPILLYSNYVKMEGLEMIKLYLKYFGFTDFANTEIPSNDYYRYTEFHGEIDRDTRKSNLKNFNSLTNIFGKDIKVILISPAGSEGISLLNVRQVHVLEPYWNEVRIEQLIGRAIRQCSHKDLPFNERYVDIFRYLAT